MSELIHINIDDILSGWSHACDKIENDEQVGWSVGRIAQWGGHYICVIHDDVPVDEREEIAKFIASAPETIKRLQAKHDQAIKEAVEKAWISVDDDLPDEPNSYLTYWTDGEIEVVSYRDHRELFEGKMISAQIMTHWMPLPPPPKTGGLICLT